MRVRGWLQLVIGLFLVGFMGTITYRLAPSLLGIYTTEDGGKFTGTPEQAKMILSLFGLVIGFGFMSMVSGLWQIVTGRRNKWIFIFMLALFVILIFFSWYLTDSLKR
jgi:MFS family permease